MNEFYNNHYIIVDELGRITGGWSDGPQSGRNTAGTVLLTEQGGYQFRLFEGGEENPALRTEDGIPRYAWREGQVVFRTAKELEGDRQIARLDQLDALKAQMITKSKTALAEFLAANPLRWLDGKDYTVTEEKQTLLMGNIGAYQLEAQGNPGAEVTWNAAGEECTPWNFEALCALAVAIKGYVKPFVSHQQALEIAIRAAKTPEELEEIKIDYSGAADHANAG